MKPFDSPLDNLDRLHAALCPSADVRESYLSKQPDEGDHEHVHIEQQPQPQLPPPPSLDEPAMPSFLRTPPQQWDQYRRSMLRAAVGVLSAGMMDDDIASLPSFGSRIIAAPPHGQQRSQMELSPGVPE